VAFLIVLKMPLSWTAFHLHLTLLFSAETERIGDSEYGDRHTSACSAHARLSNGLPAFIFMICLDLVVYRAP
jgi:hypothetical protein